VAGNQRWPRWSPDGNRIAFQAGSAIYSVPALGGRAETLVEGTTRAPALGFDWSPDGSRMVYVLDGVIWTRLVDGSSAPTALVRDAQAHSVAWSPDGRWIVYVSGNADFVFSETLLGNVAPSRLMLVPAAGGTPVALTDGRALALSPAWIDPHTLLLIQGRGGIRDIYRMRLTSRGQNEGEPVRMTTGLDPHGIVLTADREAVVYAVLTHSSNLWSMPLPLTGVSTMRDASRVTSGRQLVEDMDVLPSGLWMAYDSNVDGSQDIWLINMKRKQTIQLTRDSTEEFGPAWSPSGEEIAFYGVTDGVRQVFVMREDGKNRTQVTFDSLQNHQPRWSPDGTSLVFNRTSGPAQNHLYMVTRKSDSSWTEPRRLSGDEGSGPNWSPDGKTIAFYDPEGRIRLVPAGGGTSRVLATPEQTGGLKLRRPFWLLDEPALLARAEGPGGQGGIWLIPTDGRPPREVARFDDPLRPVYRDDFSSDGENVYFVVTELASSLWTASLVSANR
jgi:Tol biopolymer transport system component